MALWNLSCVLRTAKIIAITIAFPIYFFRHGGKHVVFQNLHGYFYKTPCTVGAKKEGITTNDEDSSSNEKGNDGPVSDKVDDDDFFFMNKKWPKGVRICKGPVPMPRIPAREKCQGRKTLASATQRKRQRTCLSSSGCGRLSCEDCYP